LTTSVAREIVPLLAACDLGGADPLASADAAFEHATYAWQRLDPGPIPCLPYATATTIHDRPVLER